MNLQATILGTPDRRLEEMVRSCGLRPTVLPGGLDAVNLSDPAAAPPDVVIADVRGSGRLPTALVALRLRHPGTAAVLLASTLDPMLMVEAMRAGINECIAEPITVATLGDALARVLAVKGGQAGEMFAVVGAKGGVGATTMAVNVATALARSGSTLLIDLHPSLGDAALLFGAEPRFSVSDAVENTHRLDQSFFEGLAVQTDAGPWLLASPEQPSQQVVDPGRLRLLLEFATRHYRYTILDVPRNSRPVLESLATATSIVVVTSQELASVRAASRLSDMLRRRYGREKTSVVLSRADAQAEIGRDDIEMAVHGAIRFTFPSDYRVALDAFNLGHPLVLAKTGRLAEAYAQFAEVLTGRAARPAAPVPAIAAGLIGRLSALRWTPTL
jgi:pilus assembly protein CpaE